MRRSEEVLSQQMLLGVYVTRGEVNGHTNSNKFL